MLGNTLYSLNRTRALTVAYFGGSITEGGGENGWRRLTTKWFESCYPDAKITEVNAAIGGTDTALGVFRCDRDVIAYRPDLTFVEFAVNDSGCDPDSLARCTEAIVRKLRLANPAMDIVFVFTITKRLADDLASGIPFRSRDVHAAIAAHYALPVIDCGTPLAEAAQAHEGGWLAFTADNVHPNAEGYAIKEKIVTQALSALLTGDTPDAPAAHQLPALLYSALPMPARLVDALPLADRRAQPDSSIETDWAQLPLHLCGRWPTCIGSNRPGNELTFRFEGTQLGVYWMMSSDSGDIDYRIDDGEWLHKSSWDIYCLKFARANFHMLAADLPDGEHTLTLRISATHNEQSTGHWVRIGAFGVC